MTVTRLRVLGLLLAALAFPTGTAPNLYGQVDVGRIIGTVRDPSGAVTPNAAVTAKLALTSAQTHVTTDAAGTYAFDGLSIGEYSVTVQVAGFKTAERTNVRVISSVTTTADFQLEIGATAQSVRVSAAATVLDTTETSAGTTRVNEEIEQLPLVMTGTQRSAEAFLRTYAGVSWVPGLIDDGSQGIFVASINGAPEGGEGYSVDGIDARVSTWGSLRDDFSPPPEMIDEERLTSNSSSELSGQNSGVGFALVSKSGTNKLHGNVYNFLHNSATDSRNFFAAKTTPLKQDEFGFTLGGPFVIPHVYNGINKTFFFGMFSGYRLRETPSGETGSVPTQAMRSGDFSELLGAQIGTDALGRPIYNGEIYDPSTTRVGPGGVEIRDPFMYNGQMNVINPASLSHVSSVFQGGYPLPNLPGTSLNWVGVSAESPVNSNKGALKVDQLLSGGKQRVTFAFDHWKRNETFGAPFGPLISNTWILDDNTQQYRLLYEWTLTPHMVFNFRVAFNRCDDLLGQNGLASNNGAVTAGLTGVYSNVTPIVSITNETGFGPPFGGIIHEPGYGLPINTDLSWAKGKHDFKFGASYINFNFVEIVASPSSGSYNFTQYETGQPGAPAGTGFGYASYLLGAVDSASIASPIATKWQNAAWGFYAQDSWRLTPKLTVSYGLRWDIFIPVHEGYNRATAFDPSIPNPGAGGLLGALTFWGHGPGRNGLTEVGDIYWKEFSPRLGFAYAITPKTLIRGSYGLSSPDFMGTTGEGISSLGWNLSGSKTSTDLGVTPAFNWDNGYPSGTIPPLPDLDPTLGNGSGVTWVIPKQVKPGRTQNISFGIERELPGGILAKADYVGNLTHGLPLSGINFNQMNPSNLSLGSLLLSAANSPAAQAAGIQLPYPGFGGSVANALEPYPQFPGGVSQWNYPTGYNEYNAAQIQVQKHTGQGLSVLVAYTISKQLTNHAFYYGQPQASVALQDVEQLRSTKRLADLDRPQSLTLSWIYELPFGPGKHFANTSNPALKQVVGGWQVAAVQNYESGTPIGISTNEGLPGGFGGDFAVRVPGVPIRANSCSSIDPGNPSNRSLLNIAAFTDPAPFTLGNTRFLGDVRTCGYLNENISLIKKFMIREHANVLFSADFTNLFNRHNWAGLATNIDNPSQFGRFGATALGGGGAGGNNGSGASDPRYIQFQFKISF